MATVNGLVNVTVTWAGEETVTVWAKDKTEAEQEAFNKIDIDDVDVEYDVRSV